MTYARFFSGSETLSSEQLPESGLVNPRERQGNHSCEKKMLVLDNLLGNCSRISLTSKDFFSVF